MTATPQSPVRVRRRPDLFSTCVWTLVALVGVAQVVALCWLKIF